MTVLVICPAVVFGTKFEAVVLPPSPGLIGASGVGHPDGDGDRGLAEVVLFESGPDLRFKVGLGAAGGLDGVERVDRAGTSVPGRAQAARHPGG